MEVSASAQAFVAAVRNKVAAHCWDCQGCRFEDSGCWRKKLSPGRQSSDMRAADGPCTCSASRFLTSLSKLCCHVPALHRRSTASTRSHWTRAALSHTPSIVYKACPRRSNAFRLSSPSWSLEQAHQYAVIHNAQGVDETDRVRRQNLTPPCLQVECPLDGQKDTPLCRALASHSLYKREPSKPLAPHRLLRPQAPPQVLRPRGGLPL